jgi:thiamine-phosphate pyrophosphorylase
MDLRLIVITDSGLAGERGFLHVVHAALRAGAPAIQLRYKDASAGELLELAQELLPPIRAANALLFINDRVDVALAAGADGVHRGPDDMPVAAARRIAPRLLIGYSTDDPDTARRAEQDGASYIGCGAVFGTTTKPGLADERIGLDRLREVVRAVSIPVVGIGGIGVHNVAGVRETGAAGVAVVGAVMGAGDPEGVVRRLLGSLGGG